MSGHGNSEAMRGYTAKFSSKERRRKKYIHDIIYQRYIYGINQHSRIHLQLIPFRLIHGSQTTQFSSICFCFLRSFHPNQYCWCYKESSRCTIHLKKDFQSSKECTADVLINFIVVSMYRQVCCLFHIFADEFHFIFIEIEWNSLTKIWSII